MPQLLRKTLPQIVFLYSSMTWKTSIKRVEPNSHTVIIKSLCINLYLSYYFLFILFSDPPPWIMKQGHQVRSCVFCLQSPCRLFRDEVVVYKSVTSGSGPQPRQWFIIWHRARASWLIRSCITMYEKKSFWKCVYSSTEHESLCFSLAVNSDNVSEVCDITFPVYVTDVINDSFYILIRAVSVKH